jgi:hypothetical protein
MTELDMEQFLSTVPFPRTLGNESLQVYENQTLGAGWPRQCSCSRRAFLGRPQGQADEAACLFPTASFYADPDECLCHLPLRFAEPHWLLPGSGAAGWRGLRGWEEEHKDWK